MPKLKNPPQYNKYKSLKINIVSSNRQLNLNNNDDIYNTTINKTLNSIPTQNTQITLQNDNLNQGINKNKNLIKNHITALKRKIIKKNIKSLDNTIINFTSNNILDNRSEEENLIQNIQKTINSVYSKPIFKKISNKIDKNNYKSARNKNNLENKINGTIINNNNSISENNKNENMIINTVKENNNNNKNSLIIKKIIKRIKPNNLNIKSNNNKNGYNSIDLKNIKMRNKHENLNNINKSRNKESKKNDNNNLKSIITKSFISKDKKLNIFIKYYELNNEKFYNNIFNSSFSIIPTDSITFLNATTKNRNNNRYLKEILSSIIEEDEKSKANPSINNSNSAISEEDIEKHKSNHEKKYDLNKKSFTNNLIIYLTNILQNLYDDNKKMILYLFMRNLKKIQNQLYLKNSLNQYNYMINNGEKENNVYNKISNNNENIMIKSNGRNEAKLNNEKRYKERNNINNRQFFYTIDNSLYSKINNQKNILIGSLLFKDFEIKDDNEYLIKPKKKSFSSSSINQINKTASIRNEFNKKIFEKIIIDINNKKNINYYFKYWKNIMNGIMINFIIIYLILHLVLFQLIVLPS